jgi:hypothetical protein
MASRLMSMILRLHFFDISPANGSEAVALSAVVLQLHRCFSVLNSQPEYKRAMAKLRNTRDVTISQSSLPSLRLLLTEYSKCLYRDKGKRSSYLSHTVALRLPTLPTSSNAKADTVKPLLTACGTATQQYLPYAPMCRALNRPQHLLRV